MGGLSALRVAATCAAVATLMGKPARVLVFGCELCSLFIHAEMAEALRDNALHIAPALFSDAAAATVLVKGVTITEDRRKKGVVVVEPFYEVREWGCSVVPGTLRDIEYLTIGNGMLRFSIFTFPCSSSFLSVGNSYLVTLLM